MIICPCREIRPRPDPYVNGQSEENGGRGGLRRVFRRRRRLPLRPPPPPSCLSANHRRPPPTTTALSSDPPPPPPPSLLSSSHSPLPAAAAGRTFMFCSASASPPPSLNCTSKSTQSSLTARLSLKKRPEMWRSVAKQAPWRKVRSFTDTLRFLSGDSPVGRSGISILSVGNSGGGRLVSQCWKEPWEDLGLGAGGSRMIAVRSVASAAQVETVSSEEDDLSLPDIGKLIDERKVLSVPVDGDFGVKKKSQKIVGGVGQAKHWALRKRQIKIETEAWEQAAKEYKELLSDMCEQKLAPNLPYMKSLFLGWFEPLRDRITEEQELYREGKNKAPYFDHLPADMMSDTIDRRRSWELSSGSSSLSCW